MNFRILGHRKRRRPLNRREHRAPIQPRHGQKRRRKRSEEVKTIFETRDLALTKLLLNKYQVAYIFVGDKEREKYKLEEDKFLKLSKIVYQSGTTIIYKID